MPLTRREKAGYATIGTGGALVYGSAQLNDRGIENGLKLAGKDRKALPGLRAWRATKDLPGRRVPRLQMAGGQLGRAVGTVGVIGGAAEVARGRKWRKDNPNNKIVAKSLVKEGLKGNLEAVKDRGENLTEPKPLGAVGWAAGIGLAGSSAGSLAVHRKLDKTKKAKAGLKLKNRPGLVAMGGLAGLGASAPVARAVVERKYPEYKVTAAGVQRRKTAPVRPSRMAAIYNQKQLGRGAFRQGVVPSDVRKLDTNYRGFGMDERKKRAAIFGAGSIPVVGDFAAARTAGSLAPPEQRKRAERVQLAGNLGGSLGGGAVGALAAGEIARRSDRAKNKMTGWNSKISDTKAAAIKPITDRLPQRADKPSVGGAAASTWNKVKSAPGKLVPKAAKTRYAGVGGAVAFGALAGQVAGGQTGGYKATSYNLRRERERNKTVAKALLVVNQGQKVDREANELAARRKKRSARISTVGGTLGVAGFGMMAAAKKPSIAAKYPKLADQARDVGLAGGGIGGANALYYARLQRKEADALRAQRSTPSSQKVYKGDLGMYTHALLIAPKVGDGVRREVARSLVFGPPKGMDPARDATRLSTKLKAKKGKLVQTGRGRLVPAQRAAVVKGMPGTLDLTVARGLGTLRRPTYRDSALVTRRGRGGTLMTTRRKASIG